jgi:mannose-6-phosphate isomerase
MTVWPLRGAIRDYAWGSRSFIAGLQGRPGPSPAPEAELWLGAHPGAPATVEQPGGPVSLAAAIAADPERALGPTVGREFGTRLPFLLKVLAADAPLSLQAHPDAARAREAFLAGHPGYVDECHKPEMLVALTPFDALCGFRAPDISAAVIEALDVAALAPVVADLRAGPGGLRPAVRTLLGWPASERLELLDAVVKSAFAARGNHPYTVSFRLVRELAAHYPGDPGVLVALLLNQVRLEPGQAIWMPAGNLHAYLRGAGVEIMAASDNVLRGGLTPKQVDVPELLRVVSFEVLEEPVRSPRQVAPGVVTWPASAREFALHRVTVDGTVVRLPVGGPRVVLCVRGTVTVADADADADADAGGGGSGGGGGGGGVPVASGGAAFVTADGGPLVIAGQGETLIASVGRTTAT